MKINASCLISLLTISSSLAVFFNSQEQFVLYPSLDLCHNGSFSLEFRTSASNGLIFYTYDQYSSDFILVSIAQRKLVVQQRFAKSKSHQIFDQSVDDDRWYKIVFKRRSPLITELNLYSVALRNVESRTLKNKILHYYPFTQSNGSSIVYIGGLPKSVFDHRRSTSEFLFSSYSGYVRNLRYGFCGCAERIEEPLFSSTTISSPSEVCEQQRSLCSSSSCECLNVDEEPRYQCDCSNKTCALRNRNRVEVKLDLTSKDETSSFLLGTEPYRYKGWSNSELQLFPVDSQLNSCLWDLTRCANDLSISLTFAIEHFNRSMTIFSQSLKHNAALQINFIVVNSSLSNLQIDLWLPSNTGLLRTQLNKVPREKMMFLNVIYRSSPWSLSVFLFGQLIDSSTTILPIPTRKLSTNDSLALKMFVPVRSIVWSYDPSECCGSARMKRDLIDLESCQCKCRRTTNSSN